MRSQEASAKIRTIILIMIRITMIIIAITIIIYSIHHHHHHHHHSSPLKANLRIFRARPVLACPAHRGAFVSTGSGMKE
jgi:flagellar basal body-associated protein FliL